jgi:nucleotide-binding universal stress UspA family protein
MGGPCAIAVAPRGFARAKRRPLRIVSAGFDGSPAATEALKGAHALAQVAGATMRAIAIAEPVHLLERVLGSASDAGKNVEHGPLAEQLEQELASLEGVEVDRVVESGHPLPALRTASEEADVLVVGSRGYGPLHHVVLGSVSAKLMRSAPCPVMVVPRGAPSPAAALAAAGASTG